MELADEITIPAPRDRVYEALNDVAILKACIPGCEELVSRLQTVTFTNVGQRPCTEITLGGLIPDPNSAEMFEYYPSNSAPAPFELQPGESFGPVQLIFKRSVAELVMNHFGKLPYTSAEGSAE